MPHGFGEMVKGVSDIAGYAGGGAVEFGKNAYDSSMGFVKKRLDEMRDEQLRIEDPGLFDEKGDSINYKTENLSSSTFTKAEKKTGANRLSQDNRNFFKKKRGVVHRKAASLFKHGTSNLSSTFKGGVLSGGLYGLSAYASDDESKDAGDRMTNVAKHGAAWAVDTASDLALGGVSTVLATFGGVPGAVVAGGINAFNMFAGFAGLDAGSLAMNIMNSAEERYEEVKRGPKFNMTENTSMAMQRQIQNMHASGSNLGEMMHN